MGLTCYLRCSPSKTAAIFKISFSSLSLATSFCIALNWARVTGLPVTSIPMIWAFFTQPVTVCTAKWYSLARELAERHSLYKATIDDLNSVEYRLAFII